MIRIVFARPGAYVDVYPGGSAILLPGRSKRLSCVGPKRVSAWGLFFRSSLGVLMGREEEPSGGPLVAFTTKSPYRAARRVAAREALLGRIWDFASQAW